MFDSWVGKIPWRKKWQLTSVFLPGESHGQRSWVSYIPWGRKESDTTEHSTHTPFCAEVGRRRAKKGPGIWGRWHLPAGLVQVPPESRWTAQLRVKIRILCPLNYCLLRLRPEKVSPYYPNTTSIHPTGRSLPAYQTIFFFSAHLSFIVLAHNFVLYPTSPSLLPLMPLSRTGWSPPARGSGDLGLWQGCAMPGGDPTLSLGLLPSTGQAPWLESQDV